MNDATDKAHHETEEVTGNRTEVMEPLLGIALKAISNWLDHISPAPIDLVFAAEIK